MPERSTLIARSKCACGWWAAFRELADGRLRVEVYTPGLGRPARLRTPCDRAQAEALFRTQCSDHTRSRRTPLCDMGEE